VLKLIAVLALVAAIGAATYALAGGNEGHTKQGKHEKQGHGAQPFKDDAHDGPGPPPWAPAYGWRCKEAGNTPGSADFKACIKAKKR
jgi:hypothetical protein